MGGGSLGYANTLYRARPAFYGDPQWKDLADWAAELAPHYDTAEHMLGVTEYDEDSPAGKLLREYATEHGFGDTYTRTRVGVFLGEPGVTVKDPFFDGAGPERTGCVKCGSCMVGCRHNAKNTLVKNYLYFAERLGVEILPERTVVDVRPLGAPPTAPTATPSRTRASGAWVRGDRRRLTAGGVVVAAGPLGTNRLLFRCKLAGSLPRLSGRLGELVRTNSESILAVTAPPGAEDFGRGIAITASVYPDPDTHIEPVTYGGGADSQSLLFWLLTEAGTRRTQPLHLLANLVRHPRLALSAMRIKDWSGRTVILLVMQTLDNAMRLKVKRRLPGGTVVLTTEQDPNNPQPGQDSGGLPRRGVDPPTSRRDPAGDVHRSPAVNPHHRTYPWRRRDRQRREQWRDRRRPARVRLPEPAGVRRCRGPGQHRGQSEPDHHRDGRTRTRADPAQGGRHGFDARRHNRALTTTGDETMTSTAPDTASQRGTIGADRG